MASTLHTENGQVSVDIYLYLEYGVAVPSVAVAIQKSKSAVYDDMADVTLDAVNIHVVGITNGKISPKQTWKDLFNEGTSSMTSKEILLESRRDLHQKRLPKRWPLGIRWNIINPEACPLWPHDKDLQREEDKEVDLPAFLMNLVTGIYQSKDQLDQQIGSTFENRLDYLSTWHDEKASIVWEFMK